MRKKFFALFLMGSLIIGPSLVGTNSVKANPIDGVGTILEAIVDLFCPEHPQNRCKHGKCMDGACISFRSACISDSNCN